MSAVGQRKHVEAAELAALARNGCIWPAELVLGSEAGAELAAGGGFSLLVTVLKANHRKGCISYFTQGTGFTTA